jgi:signal transduction histidine kinase
MTRSLRQVLTRMEHLEVLYKVSNLINTTLEPAKILHLLMEEVVQITEATSGSIAMIDPKKGVLNIETAINIPTAVWKDCKLELGVGVTGYTAWTGKPMRVDDVTRDPHYVRLKSDIRSEMALPMVLDGKVIGVINVDSTRVAAFSREDEDLCMAVANQSAKVIETARLHEAVKAHAEQMEALFTVGNTLIQPGPLEQLLDRIVDEGVRLLNGKICVLMEVQEGGKLRNWAIAGGSAVWNTKAPISVSESLIGQCIRRGAPLCVANVLKSKRYKYAELAEKEGLVSLLAVPVIHQEKVLAVLALYSGQTRKFRESEVQLLQLLANQGAIAIKNAQHMDQVAILEGSLRRAERFSVLGTLAAEIAHEIRNPITIINLLMHNIAENAQHTDETRGDLGIITEKLNRINNIVEQTLNMSRSTESNFHSTNLNRQVEDLIVFMNYKMEKQGIKVTKSLDSKLPEFPADSGQIQQVLLNLIVNAMDAMKEGGKLKLRTRLGSDRHIGPCARFVIEDSGIGIPQEEIPRLFEPFYTTRTTGTGLGLFISDKLVRRHSGNIKIKSIEGKGTSITVTLPLKQEAVES